MSNITYWIMYGENDGFGQQCLDYAGVHTPEEAARQARKAVAEGKTNVYVEWLRASDGQRAYLNPGENHELAGKRWDI